ncbi:LysR family transcriptional regulator [Acinetobacter sp. ABJ_C4_1]|uniref:LysR family transcriptional regulator n=1 Tax=Acinetobacter sp. ABJ_C4_1 TaxID=3377080 RepID=UPI0037CB2ACD
MDSFNGIVYFVKTAEALSFVGAARALGVSASAVGKSIAKLEQAMGVRLFQRSTRKVHLTAEGEMFYQRCRSILDDLDEAQAMLSHAIQTPRGKLRLSLPTIGYHFLLSELPEFRRLYPEIELDIDFNDQLVDVIKEGFDIVIRSGDLPDSKLMSQRLGTCRHVLCAAPAYLARRGIPRTPVELEQHDCIRYRFPNTGKLMAWTMSADPLWSQLRLHTILTFNNMEAVLTATIDGHGIAYMPDFLVHKAFEEGKLQIVLNNAEQELVQFWALWPSNRHLSPKIRAFVDFISKKLFRLDLLKI